MKILHVMGASAQGGAENTLLDTVLGMAPHCQQMVISKPHAWRDQQLATVNVERRHAPFKSPSWDIITHLAVRRAIKEFQPDIIQSWMRRGAGFVPKHTNAVTAAYWGNYYQYQHFTHCDHLLAPSQGILRYAREEGWPEERTHQLIHYTADTVERERDEEIFGTTRDQFVVLGIGRLAEGKGFEVLLEAFAQLPEDTRANCVLWIAGDGPKRAELEALATQLGIMDQTRFLGWRDDHHRIMRMADLCVFSTYHEGFGMITLEAWAQKTPLIASDVIGPNALITDGEDGLLIDKGNVGAFSSAMGRCISSPELCEKLRDAGYKTFKEKFCQEKAIQQLLNTYSNLLAKVERQE